MQKWEFDVFGMVKTNLDWRLVQEDEKPYARIKEWWDTLHLSVVYLISPGCDPVMGDNRVKQ
jgi:hypothetical protein